MDEVRPLTQAATQLDVLGGVPSPDVDRVAVPVRALDVPGM